MRIKKVGLISSFFPFTGEETEPLKMKIDQEKGKKIN